MDVAAVKTGARSLPPPSRLFHQSIIDNRDEWDEKLERSYQHLQHICDGMSDKDAHEAINKALRENDKGYEEVSFGMLVTILTEPQNAAKAYRDLTLISHDGFALILTHLSQMVLDRYLKFTDIVKCQLMWLIREMMKNSVSNVHNLLALVMRYAAGGDTTPRNVALIEQLVDLLTEYRTIWLERYPLLIPTVCYTFLRLLEDHQAPHLAALRQREVTLVVALIRERFTDCLTIGRDLIRLLQNVARIPEVEQLWRDMLTAPRTLHPTLSGGILQVLQMRTSRRHLQSRLTPDMERKLVFFTSQVRFGNHKRYQDWFQRQYLATPESQSLRCDIIRFIVGVIHPTNELLGSDIIPRWAVIGWLLTTCTSSVAVSNAKLALFYDWLFYDGERDNIMNIEPAILVMHHSMRSHPAVSATLLDFLCRIIPNFYPPLADRVRAGIYSSLRQILDKRVLPSLMPLFNNAKLDRELRTMVHDTFKEFCTNSTPLVQPPSGGGGLMNVTAPTATPPVSAGSSVSNASTLNNHHIDAGGGGGGGGGCGSGEPAFSDDDEEGASTNASNDYVMNHHCQYNNDDDDDVDVEEEEAEFSSNADDDENDDDDDDDIPLSKVLLKGSPKSSSGGGGVVNGAIGAALCRLYEERDRLKRCDIMVNLIHDVMLLDDSNDHHLVAPSEDISLGQIAKQLCRCFETDLQREFCPDVLTEENLLLSIRSPLFILFKTLYNFTKPEGSGGGGGGGDNSGKDILIRLTAEMYRSQPQLGYLLLYFLKVQTRTETKREDHTKASALKVGVYKEFCHVLDRRIDSGLYEDLCACHVADTRLMMWIVPDLFRDFKQATVNNARLIHVIISAIDACQLQTLVGKVLQGHLVMFRGEGLVGQLLRASLQWESVEQVFLWQLLNAHDTSIETVLPLIQNLDYERHPEALTAITLMLKQERPSADYVKQLFSRQLKVGGVGDHFIFTVIKYWCDEYIDKVAELVAGLLTSRYPSTSPNKRKRQTSAATKTTAPPPPLNAQTVEDGTTTAAPVQLAVQPSADQVLRHLDRLREICVQHDCMAIYTLDSMQRALTVAQTHAGEAHKKQFSQLFALLEEEETATAATTMVTKRQQGRGRKSTMVTAAKGTSSSGAGSAATSTGAASSTASKRSTAVAHTTRDLSDSSADSSEEEEIVKPKQAKKRKKVMSDSD